MQLLGDVEQVVGNLLILLLQVIIHLSDSMNRHTDPVVNIPVGNALGQFGQLLGALALQLGANTVFSDLFQNPLDVGRSPGVPCSLVVIVTLCCTALGSGERVGVCQRDAASLLFGNRLTGARRGLPFHGHPFRFGSILDCSGGILFGLGLVFLSTVFHR